MMSSIFWGEDRSGFITGMENGVYSMEYTVYSLNRICRLHMSNFNLSGSFLLNTVTVSVVQKKAQHHLTQKDVKYNSFSVQNLERK